MRQYFQITHTLYYSLIASFPLLVTYEIVLALASPSTWQVRNAADVWLRQVLMAFEIRPHHLSFAMMILLLAMIPFAHIRQHQPLRWKYFGWMLLEALGYSLFLGGAIHTLLQFIFLAQPMLVGTFFQNFALSLGAGLFEEFFFRVLLLNALFLGLRVISKNFWISGLGSILLASFLFSLSHYVGALADPFNIYTFLFRWIAGLIFTILYFLRGFAVTAYTHAFYDILVLT